MVQNCVCSHGNVIWKCYSLRKQWRHTSPTADVVIVTFMKYCTLACSKYIIYINFLESLEQSCKDRSHYNPLSCRRSYKRLRFQLHIITVFLLALLDKGVRLLLCILGLATSLFFALHFSLVLLSALVVCQADTISVVLIKVCVFYFRLRVAQQSVSKLTAEKKVETKKINPAASLVWCAQV